MVFCLTRGYAGFILYVAHSRCSVQLQSHRIQHVVCVLCFSIFFSFFSNFQQIISFHLSSTPRRSPCHPQAPQHQTFPSGIIVRAARYPGKGTSSVALLRAYLPLFYLAHKTIDGCHQLHSMAIFQGSKSSVPVTQPSAGSIPVRRP